MPENRSFDFNGLARTLADKVQRPAASIALVLLAGGVSIGTAVAITKNVWVEVRRVSTGLEKCEDEVGKAKARISELENQIGSIALN